MCRYCVALLVVLILVAACGGGPTLEDPSKAETCGEMEDLSMLLIQGLVDLADTVPVDQFLAEGISSIDDEAAQPWLEQSKAVENRAEELGCDIEEDVSFIRERIGELTFKTRSGERFIENFLEDL